MVQTTRVGIAVLQNIGKIGLEKLRTLSNLPEKKIPFETR
jgi:hypothetical protein